MPSMNALIAACIVAAPLFGQEVSILVSGTPRPEYEHRGTTYIEALRGREFTIRLTNPTSQRVAVALSVDGLNTIDARHTDAWGAAKWVLEPYQSADIAGWQVSDRTARRFFFTGERNSYGAALGQTENLGIIEAVFYRERRPRWAEGFSKDQRREAPRAAAESQAPSAAPSDDYAATGMGNRTRHDVEQVAIDLERSPISTVSIR